jgi:hypothetical protein
MPGPLNFSGFFCKLLNLNECVLPGSLNFSGPRFRPPAAKTTILRPVAGKHSGLTRSFRYFREHPGRCPAVSVETIEAAANSGFPAPPRQAARHALIA